MWAPPPCGSHIIKTARQNHSMVRNKRFQELDGQRSLVFGSDGQNQTLTIVRWPKMDFFPIKKMRLCEVCLVLGVRVLCPP
jgi:hypothetical protein